MRFVSTHSRAKAAASSLTKSTQCISRFNTQPREGGCVQSVFLDNTPIQFQHTAARRRLLNSMFNHSSYNPSFNTQPREGGCDLAYIGNILIAWVSTHSRAKAAAFVTTMVSPSLTFQHTAARRRLLIKNSFIIFKFLSFNTQPREGGCKVSL